MDDPAERTEVIDARPATDRLPTAEPVRRRSRFGRAVAVVVAVAVLFVAGYAGYRVITDRRAPRPVAQGPTGPTGSPTGSPSAPPSTPPSTPTPLPPAESGPLVVPAPALTGRPETTAVVALFTRYFDGINRRDYEAVQGTFTDEGRPIRDRATFEDQYRTTRDSDVRVLGIAMTDDGYLVSISFTSHQNPADAPADARSACVTWSMSYPVVRSDGGGLLIAARPNTAHYAC
jgi:hypothetical protein